MAGGKLGAAVVDSWAAAFGGLLVAFTVAAVGVDLFYDFMDRL